MGGVGERGSTELTTGMKGRGVGERGSTELTTRMRGGGGLERESSTELTTQKEMYVAFEYG